MLIQLLLLSVVVLLADALPFGCEKKRSDLLISKHPTPNDGRYYLEIDDGSLEKYVPSRKYNVAVKVDIYWHPSSKFKNFLLSVESRATPDDDVTQQTGKFELTGDGLSRFSHVCPNTVNEATSQPKNQVNVTWVAPPPNSGCVTIKATVVESKDKWYSDDEATNDGFLTKTLCENLDEDEDSMPELLDYCCACDEAKYELAFQGNWIRNNHPKGFPEDLFTTRFSDIIGASHKLGHEFWNIGEEPSAGLKELAFNGSTRSLESELMDKIAHLHTIIKARGLTYPNITSSSFAIFRVDNENHVVSLVSKIMPSPDWIVGVSNFELCLSNCSWKQFRTINLYPKDVGIDDGLEYTESIPSDNSNPIIKEITSTDPMEPRSPFYNENGDPIKPIARLHFKLEKVYKKECDPDRKPAEEVVEVEPEGPNKEEISFVEPPMKPNRDPNKCETMGWSKWSSCSVQCGKGHMTRNVKFKHSPVEESCGNIVKEETQECESTCEPGEETMEICPNIIWSQWTQCSSSCGKGTKKRYRIGTPIIEEEESEKQCANMEEVECEEIC